MCLRYIAGWLDILRGVLYCGSGSRRDELGFDGGMGCVVFVVVCCVVR